MDHKSLGCLAGSGGDSDCLFGLRRSLYSCRAYSSCDELFVIAVFDEARGLDFLCFVRVSIHPFTFCMVIFAWQQDVASTGHCRTFFIFDKRCGCLALDQLLHWDPLLPALCNISPSHVKRRMRRTVPACFSCSSPVEFVNIVRLRVAMNSMQCCTSERSLFVCFASFFDNCSRLFW